VPQEPVAEALAGGRPGDQAGHVGEDEVVVAGPHHPQHRLQGGEGVVGHLGPGRRGPGHDAGLAGVGEADQPGVGQRAQLQGEAALAAGLALLVEGGDPAPGPGEGGVAAAAPTALGGQEPRPRPVQVGEQLPAAVADQGADRHRQGAAVAVGALAVAPLPVGAPPGPLVGVEVVLDQGADTRVGDQDHVAAAAAVAAVRAAPRLVLLAVERGHAVTAAPGGHLDGGLVDEHRSGTGPRPGARSG